MKRLKKTTLIALTTGSLSLLTTSPAVFPHCEIPCGIYDDQIRLDMMEEHIRTIEKAVNQINALSVEQDKNFNQLVRWIMNKESHADQMSDIVTQYFMKQRIKPEQQEDAEAYKQYVRKLTLLHNIMVYSMKCKQTVELAHVAKLKSLLSEFRVAYLGPEISAHHEHKP
jgi:nickel superoxide dismutase